jgi:hypothetical protein
MDDCTPQAKAYWWTTTLVGAAALGLAVASVGRLEPGAVLQILGGTDPVGAALATRGQSPFG